MFLIEKPKIKSIRLFRSPNSSSSSHQFLQIIFSENLFILEKGCSLSPPPIAASIHLAV